MDFYDYYGLNRTMCDVLRELRTCGETGNYSILPSLLEEIQSMANRMEAKLGTIKDFERLEKNLKEGREELKKLRAETEALAPKSFDKLSEEV